MPKTGHFILHSSFLPSVTAGRYQLVSEHVSVDANTPLPFPVAPETTQVHVAAPRFTMPTDQILSTFPPANAAGAFGDRLPQIVLKRRTLPWERNPDPAQNGAVSERPWLALVVVAEGEAQLSTATPVAQCVTPGTNLRNPDDRDVEQGLYLAVTETVVKKIFPCKQDLELLVHVREVDVNDTELANGDDDGWLAVVLANRLPVIDGAGKPVRYMACLVNVESQLDALPAPSNAVDSFKFELAQDWSVLAEVAFASGPDVAAMGGGSGGKVLPKAPANLLGPGAAGVVSAGKRPPAAAALDGGAASVRGASVSDQWSQATRSVSAAALDPDAQRLVRDTMGIGFRYPIELFAAEKVFRFPVLAHWSFTTNEGATFEKLMQGLDVGLLGTLPETRPGDPPPVSMPEVVATGHVGLGHRARRGDAVRAWYRGPCVPFPTPRDGANGSAPLELAHAADQLRRVIPDGREDLALASAFEIGRLLALSQLSVVSALLRFRGEQFGAGRVRELLRRVVDFDLPKLVTNAGRDYVDLGRFVAVQAIDLFAQQPERVLGPVRPVADPGRELRVEGDLDALIATGLGFDLAQVRKRSGEVGVIAALQATAVPLAARLGAQKLDARGVAALRGALQAELARTLDVAAPPRATVPTRGPGAQKKKAPRGAAAARRSATAPSTATRDVLGELIGGVQHDDDDQEENTP